MASNTPLPALRPYLPLPGPVRDMHEITVALLDLRRVGRTVKMYSGGTALALGAGTKVPLTDVVFNQDAELFDPDTTDGSVSVLWDGTYWVLWQPTVDGLASSNATPYVILNDNGSNVVAQGSITGSGSQAPAAMRPVALSAGDKLTPYVYTDGSGVTARRDTSDRTVLTLTYMGPGA